ncbi:MAG: hypothetical protein B7Z58_11575 [Acidiphilium sp. 37-64-53]|jgi:nucleoid-associated protein YgaU|uniref:hypothetical protein n=1 Tax=Acidiphilium TaxID=522 RepID=UPI000BC6B149|nr:MULTISPECIES: hypothetical protein [Acidiphilium]OYW01421.1 MAG: hypothetical protein B7Z58_11575 [Acidiphilium sp. 37-64-53]OZB25999.1 MAG: hypothetical protein B7X49_12960 [Acidiphilium sp. 34-64-41]HQT85933.1 hypothetical protein [Acidiphilium rubrum]
MSETMVTVVGGNLFAIAAQYLGDATQWIRIAQANDLRDPVLSGVVTLVLPPVDPLATGGVPNV